MQRPTALAVWAVATPTTERMVPAAHSRVGRGRLAVPAAGANRRGCVRLVTGAFVLGARADAFQCLGLLTPCHGGGSWAGRRPCANAVSPAWERVRRVRRTGETETGFATAASRVFKEFCLGTVLAALTSATQTDAWWPPADARSGGGRVAAGRGVQRPCGEGRAGRARAGWTAQVVICPQFRAVRRGGLGQHGGRAPSGPGSGCQRRSGGSHCPSTSLKERRTGN